MKHRRQEVCVLMALFAVLMNTCVSLVFWWHAAYICLRRRMAHIAHSRPRLVEYTIPTVTALRFQITITSSFVQARCIRSVGLILTMWVQSHRLEPSRFSQGHKRGRQDTSRLRFDVEPFTGHEVNLQTSLGPIDEHVREVCASTSCNA